VRGEASLSETLDDLEWKGARREALQALCREIGDDEFPSRVPRFMD
jgi:hypothetical protein